MKLMKRDLLQRITGLFLILSCLLSTMISCGGGKKPDETTDKDSVTAEIQRDVWKETETGTDGESVSLPGGYRLVYGVTDDEDCIGNGAQYFYSQLFKRTHELPELVPDNTEPVNREIVFGQTAREGNIPLDSLTYYDYGWFFAGSRLFVYGGSADALRLAVDRMFEKYFDGEALTFRIPSGVSFRAEYSYRFSGETLSIGGTPIGKYTIVADSHCRTAAKELYAGIGRLTGIRLKIVPRECLSEYTDVIDVGLRVTEDFSSGYRVENGRLSFWKNDSDLEEMNQIDRTVKRFFENEIPTDSGSFVIRNGTSGFFRVELENMSYADASILSELEGKAAQRYLELMNTESDWSSSGGGNIYYVSAGGNDSNDGLSPQTAIRTLGKVNSLSLESGDIVAFRRGDEWNEHITLHLRNGVTYSAYGEGAKPALSNYIQAAGAENWTEVGRNLWVYSGGYSSSAHVDYPNDPSLPGSYLISAKIDNISENDDVGNIVFRSGEKTGWGVKVTRYTRSNTSIGIGTVSLGDFGTLTRNETAFTDQRDLASDLEFYHNPDERRLYLYYSGGNPGETFDDIRLVISGCLADSGNRDITIDNLEFSYTGVHGINVSSIRNFTIQNCSFLWIGGSIQFYENGTPTDQKPVRYGNAFQNWGDCDGYYIRNNYVYQTYDTAGGSQIMGDINRRSVLMLDIVYTGNLFDHCLTSVENWLFMPDDRRPEDYRIELMIEDNIIVDTGFGFGTTRWNKGGNILAINEFATGIVTNNLFIRTTTDNGSLVEWEGALGVEKKINFYGNTVVLEYGQQICRKDVVTGTGKYTDLNLGFIINAGLLGENRFLFTVSDK